LEWLQRNSDSDILARWTDEIAEYQLEVRHRRGEDNPAADYLSRHFMKGLELTEIEDEDAPAEAWESKRKGKAQSRTFCTKCCVCKT